MNENIFREKSKVEEVFLHSLAQRNSVVWDVRNLGDS